MLSSQNTLLTKIISFNLFLSSFSDEGAFPSCFSYEDGTCSFINQSFLLGLDCLSTHSEMSSKLESQCIDTVMTKYPFILGMACFSK